MNDKMNQADQLEFELCQYLDGQLGYFARRRMEKRLAEDPHLREELQKYAALDEQLASLGASEIDGLDYSSQREDIMASLERRNLLEHRRSRLLVLRPRFVGGLVAVAAAVAAAFGVWTMMKPASAPVSPVSEVTVAVLAPAAPTRESVVEVTCLRMEMTDIRLAPPENLLSPDLPRGTVMVAAGRTPPQELTQAPIPFPEMR